LSSAVVRKPVVRGVQRASKVCDALLSRISSRAPLLVQTARGVPMPNLRPAAASWLATLRVREVDAVGLEVTFQGKRHVVADGARDCPSAVLVEEGSPVLCLQRYKGPGAVDPEATAASVASDAVALHLPGVEVYDVSNELVRGLFTAGDSGDVSTRVGHVNMVLSSPLPLLQRLGFATDRVQHVRRGGAAGAGAAVGAVVGLGDGDGEDDLGNLLQDVGGGGGGGGGSGGAGAGGGSGKVGGPALPPQPSRHVVSQFDPFSASSLAAMVRRSVAAGEAGKRVGGLVEVSGDENEDPEGDEDGGACCRATFALHLAPTEAAWTAAQGFVLLVDKRVAGLDGVALACATVLAAVARPLCTRVFKLPLASVALYIDVDDDAIAFNSGGRLHLNVR
jgi:hypothetical protein